MRLPAAGLLLALAGAAPGQALDCVAGFCLGQPFAPDVAGGGWQVADWLDPANCTQVSGGSLPAGVGMMLLEGRIARFEIGLTGGDEALSPPGPFGLRRGMSLGEAGARLPDEGVEPALHKYAWPPGLYLTWDNASRDRAVRVELPDGLVEVILWGRADAVRLTEGCV